MFPVLFSKNGVQISANLLYWGWTSAIAGRTNNRKEWVEIMKAFITVIGHDTVGVVAKVSTLCSELNINIEDVTQSILQGMFAMIMLVDITNCNVSHEELHKQVDALAAEMGMQINLTRQEVFDAMHTV